MPKKKSKEQHIGELWCEEAEAVGLISYIIQQPTPIPLLPKFVKKSDWIDLTYVHRTRHQVTLNKWEYQPDTFFVINEPWQPEFLWNKDLSGHGGLTFIDWKGSGARHDQDNTFAHKQKAMWAIHHIYVNKVPIKEFCEETWLPDAVWNEPTRFLKQAVTLGKCCHRQEYLDKIGWIL